MKENPAPPQTNGLFESIVMIKSVEELMRFFADLCTKREIKSIEERWRACQLLSLRRYSYQEIRGSTGLSTTTITRVARFLNRGQNNGYTCLLNKIQSQSGGPESSENDGSHSSANGADCISTEDHKCSHEAESPANNTDSLEVCKRCGSCCVLI